MFTEVDTPKGGSPRQGLGIKKCGAILSDSPTFLQLPAPSVSVRLPVLSD